MKSKLGLVAIVFVSAIALAGCGQQSQTQNRQTPSGTPGQGKPEMKEIDYAAAAETLGVSETDLKTAIGVSETTETDVSGTPGQPKRMDLATAAEKLGVTEEALKEALGMTDMGGGPNGGKASEETPPTDNN